MTTTITFVRDMEIPSELDAGEAEDLITMLLAEAGINGFECRTAGDGGDWDRVGADAKTKEWHEDCRASECWFLHDGARLHKKRFCYYQGSAHTDALTPTALMGALLRDAGDAELSFEDWCANLGMDSDSRRAGRMWRKMREIHRVLGNILGGKLLAQGMQIARYL